MHIYSLKHRLSCIHEYIIVHVHLNYLHGKPNMNGLHEHSISINVTNVFEFIFSRDFLACYLVIYRGSYTSIYTLPYSYMHFLTHCEYAHSHLLCASVLSSFRMCPCRPSIPNRHKSSHCGGCVTNLRLGSNTNKFTNRLCTGTYDQKAFC